MVGRRSSADGKIGWFVFNTAHDWWRGAPETKSVSRECQTAANWLRLITLKSNPAAAGRRGPRGFVIPARFDFAQSSLLQTDPEAVKGHGPPFDSAHPSTFA